MIKFSYFLILMLCMCCFSNVLHYKEITKETTFFHKVVIHENSMGFTINAESESEGKNISYTKLQTDKNMASIYWNYTNIDYEIHLDAKRSENIIIVTGNNSGKSINKKIKIDCHPWYQIFPDIPHGLQSLINIKDTKIKFWYLGIKPVMGILANAKKNKKYFKEIAFNNKKITSIGMNISPDGIVGILWRELYWFRKSDNVFVFVEGAIKSNKYKTVIELIPPPFIIGK